jgi:tetrahydromethanopterin S-methyltransferase subunit G
MRKTALEAHEQLCEQRYSEINRRLDNIEHEISSITGQIDDFKNWLIQTSIKIGIGAVLALFSAVYVVKWH